MDFIYERFRLSNGVKIEEIMGGKHYKGKVWLQIAKQIYCENGKDGFRDLGHFQSGAPFLYGADERISISHTDGILVVATISVPPDATLQDFTPTTALGVDVEKADRDKVVGLRQRFLSKEELARIPADSVKDNIIAWTCKEAMLKAGMNAAIDWHHDIVVTTLPSFDRAGVGYINLAGDRFDFNLTTFRSDDYIITVAKSS